MNVHRINNRNSQHSPSMSTTTTDFFDAKAAMRKIAADSVMKTMWTKNGNMAWGMIAWLNN